MLSTISIAIVAAAIALGNLIVAASVYALARSQAGFHRRVAFRSAAVEDQKVRLALLDRRIEAYRELHWIWTNWGAVPEEGAEVVHRAQALVLSSELIFAGEEPEKLRQLADGLRRWQVHERRIENFNRPQDMQRRLKVIAQQEEVEAELAPLFEETIAQLRAASRIDVVAPLAAERARLSTRAIKARSKR